MRIIILFIFGSSVLYSTNATILPKENHEVPTITTRFFSSGETCEESWNEEEKVTERCCSGSFACTSDKCKGQGLCSFGFFQSALWCFKKTCEPINSKKGEDDDSDKPSESEEPEASPEEEQTDEKGSTNDSNKVETPSPSPTGEVPPTATPSPRPSPSQAPVPSPSRSPVPTPSRTPSPRPAPPQNDPLHCNGQRNRREIRDMTPQQRREWRQAILALKQDRNAQGETEWDSLVKLHMDFSDEAHGGAYFLPWHRLFLLRLENALREKQPGLSLPYWDWSIDAGDAATSRVWNADMAGGARRTNQPIQNGDFQNSGAMYPNSHTVQRNFNSGTSGEMPALWGSNALENLINERNFGDFSDGIEAAHALPHVYIGGDMQGTWSAPNDPVFYLHHAYVDRLYEMRQQRRGRNDFGGTHDFSGGTQTAQPGHSFNAFGVPASRAFNLGCVNYVAPNLQGRSRKGTGSDEQHPEDICNNPELQMGGGFSKERCENGNKVLDGKNQSGNKVQGRSRGRDSS
ncbi:Tyrosinase copper-binding domain containing protein [Gracilaria domingensis]|nr:Tyrosinase copper-binding domain containing protein [Gracilaria domingensis]